MVSTAPSAVHSRTLLEQFLYVRRQTEQMTAPLLAEDHVVQPVADVSPPKWHLAHSTWFWEVFFLQPYMQGYQPYHPQYAYLFNSYYENLGERWQRVNRGLLSRPSVTDIMAYRQAVTEAMTRWLSTDQAQHPHLQALMLLGLAHEEQHQELLMTDIKYILGINPLRPVYREIHTLPATEHAPAPGWAHMPEGLYDIGLPDDGGASFAFDNEKPRHQVHLADFQIARRLVTAGEYLAFMQAGGYQEPRLWLSDGWTACQAEGWRAPLYWYEHHGQWWEFTLSGARPVNPHAPVTHLSYYEADAFALWSGCRLPTEAEWEAACARHAPLLADDPTAWLEAGHLHPQPASDSDQWLGHLWQWTASAYLPYPGYRRTTDALGEYNGKFMVNQHVLRGGSVVTPRHHARITYRNFFHPDKRWQFTGLRLAR